MHDTNGEQITDLWFTLVKVLQNDINHTTECLFSLRGLLASALGSQRRSIVMSFIRMWNRTFGLAETLEYPDELRRHFLRLRPLADILLPNFPEPEVQEVGLISLMDARRDRALMYAGSVAAEMV